MKLNNMMIFTALLLMFLGSKLENGLILWLASILLLLTFALHVWKLYVIRHINCTIQMKTRRLFPGEAVTGEFILENRSVLPIYGIEITFGLWNKLPFHSDFFSQLQLQNKWVRYQGIFHVGRKSRVRIPFTIQGVMRGVYRFGEVDIKFQDPFGIQRIGKNLEFFEEILVYPKEVDLRGLDQIHRKPHGDHVVRRWILDDLFFPAGARLYQPGDSFSRLDFKATAKMQELHTKVFDFTAHSDLCVASNLAASPYSWSNINEELLDRNVSIIARLARESLNQKLRFSLFVNARVGAGLKTFELPSGEGRRHYRKILEALARFSFFHIGPFFHSLAQLKQRYPSGTLLVVITAYIDEQIERELKILEAKGFEVYYVDPTLPELQLQRWNPISWQEVGQVYG